MRGGKAVNARIHRSLGALSTSLCVLCLAAASPWASPVLTPIGSMTVYVKEPVRFAVRATDPGATLSYSMTGLPAGATINASTGHFSWAPAMNDTGAHTAVFTVSNSARQASMNVVTLSMEL